MTPRASAPAKTEVQRPSGWPDSLRRYTQRAFINAPSPEEKSRLQTYLKDLIKTAQDRGELWTNDWDSMALPDLTQPADTPRGSSISASTVVRPASPFRMNFRKQNAKRERSWSPPSRESTPPSRPMTKGERKMLKKQERLERQQANKKGNTLAAQQTRPSWRPASSSSQVPIQDHQREMARARRFGNGSALGATRAPAYQYQEHGYDAWESEDVYADDGSEAFKAAVAVKGTCQEVEKSYFRLTSKPDPNLVRPEPILRQALNRLVDLLRMGKVNYFYAADQFKGMRQDCTVQHLCNELSASIYEAHARCALEHGDAAEYNQCQAQLIQHYQTGISGAHEEFAAYRLLNQAVHAGRGNHAGVLSCLQSLTIEDAAHPFVRHALQVRRALALGDCMQVCELYRSTPNMGRAIMDTVLPRVRLAAVKILAKAYLPHLPVPVIASRLAFVKSESGPKQTPEMPPPSVSALSLPGSTKATFAGAHSPQEDKANGEGQCQAWLKEHGAVLNSLPGTVERLVMDCKASLGELKAPEKAASTAHGPDLAIDDFLARAVL